MASTSGRGREVRVAESAAVADLRRLGVSERLYVRLHEDELAGPESGTPRDALRSLTVPSPLRGSVAHLLAYRERLPAGIEIVERVLPDGAVRLIVDLSPPADARESRSGLPHVYVAGPTLQPAFVRLRGALEGLSVTLAPGAAVDLLGVPAGDLRDAVVPLDALWDASRAADLACRLAAEDDDATRLHVLATALLAHRDAHAGSRPTRDARRPLAHATRALAGRALAAPDGRSAPAAIAAELAIGERRLQQLFRTHVGLSPREWHRLARLHDCLRLLRATRRPRWPDVASAAGYYDQSHLANEFRALCGLAPGAFLERAVSHSSKSRMEAAG